jgi:hypothetical protein
MPPLLPLLLLHLLRRLLLLESHRGADAKRLEPHARGQLVLHAGAHMRGRLQMVARVGMVVVA